MVSRLPLVNDETERVNVLEQADEVNKKWQHV